MDGRRISVQISHGNNSRREDAMGSGVKGGRVRNRENCCLVKGLADRTSWRDLKDFARSAGQVEYADVWNEGKRKLGIMKVECTQAHTQAHAHTFYTTASLFSFLFPFSTCMCPVHEPF